MRFYLDELGTHVLNLELLLEVVGSLVPQRLIAAVAAVRERRKWSYEGIPNPKVAARRVLALHMTRLGRTSNATPDEYLNDRLEVIAGTVRLQPSSAIVPDEYLNDSFVQAALASPEVRDVKVALLERIDRCRSLSYTEVEIVSLHREISRKRLQLACGRLLECRNLLMQSKRSYIAKLESSLRNAVLTPQRSALSESEQRLEQGRNLLMQSGHSYVAKLESSIRNAVLTPQRSALSVSQRRLEQLSLAWWRKAGDRALSDWHEESPCVRFSPNMDSDDKKLVDKWHMSRSEERKDWYERVASARRAEIEMSRTRSLTVDRQIVATPGRPIDVKNVRRIHGSYKVKSGPKRTIDGDEVAVLGVVSEPSGDGEQTVVGEADGHDLERLGYIVGRFAESIGLPLTWSAMARWKQGLGPWLMEYRPQHYSHRRGAPRRQQFLGAGYRRLVESVRRAEELEEFLGPVPPWIRGIASFHCGLMWNQDGGVVRALAEWHRFGVSASSVARSRPALFLFSLLFLLSAVKRGSWEQGRTKEQLMNALFVNDTELAQEHPVGLHDPLRTIHTFIVALDELIVRNKDLLEDVEELRLSRAGVLRGRRRDKKEFTLLAYCGGCGKSPIWAGNLERLYHKIGKSEEPGQRTRAGLPSDAEGCHLCADCFYLVCNECGFCESKCPRCPPQT